MDIITQQNKLLAALKTNPNGVNSFFATYAMGIRDVFVRIRELKDKGYKIKAVKKDKSSNFILSKTDYEGKIVDSKFYIFDNDLGISREVSYEEYKKSKEPIQLNLV